MKATNLFIIPALLASFTANAQVASVSSPDGKLTVAVDVKEGKPVYQVKYDGIQVLDDSPLGFVADNGDFSSGISYVVSSGHNLSYDYDLRASKCSKVHVDASQLVVTMKNADGNTFDIDFRVSNNDVAFRYTLPNYPSKANGKKFSIRVMKEATGFDMPEGTTTFLSPQSDAMIGWKGTKPSYEEEYQFDAPMSQKSQYGHGYTFPCLFHINGEKKDARQAWVLVSETGVDSRYCASRLSDMKGDGLYTVEFPMAEENNGNGTVEPAFALPGSTPWRTITVGTSLKPIVETTVPWNYVKPLYQASHSYEYGKGTWSWIVWQDNSICWDDQVKYIKLAQDMGFKYVLIDNWWDNNIGKDKMTELVKYAQSQGVDVFLWYSSSGWWNDIEQGPINIMSDPVKRREYMRWMQKIGVKGIKVDFFGGDKQETMRLYEQILVDADTYGIMVIFHGCTIPRGWEQMYPNYVGSEAVLASENIYFSQHFCDVEAQNTALHPFVRNTIGCMEFGGCFMNRLLNRGNTGGNTRRTTDCHELATCVLFQNPIQNFAITPENLPTEATKNMKPSEKGAPAPAICMDFLREVPTTWDETVFIDGYPGKYCVIARRHGDKWYIAGNNATGKALTLRLQLPMLTKGDNIKVYTDNIKDKEPQLSQAKVKKAGSYTVTMADQGGFVIVK